MARFIVSQDRDHIFKFDPHAPICTLPIFHDGVFYGLNLMMGSKFLGTFDSPEEAVDEISRIYNCRQEIYAVRGYCEKEEWS